MDLEEKIFSLECRFADLPASWIKYKLNDSPWSKFNGSDLRDLTTYKVKLTQPKYVNPNYRDEIIKTVSNLPDNKTYTLLYSGGYDSAVMAFLFHFCKKEFQVVVGRFKYRDEFINQKELMNINTDDSFFQAPPMFIDIQIEELLIPDRLKQLYEEFPNWHIERYLQMELIRRTPRNGVIVVGAGDPNLQKIDNDWYWVDRSCALHHFFQMQSLNLQMIPHFLTCTPELGASFVSNLNALTPIIESKHICFDFGLKADFYLQLFPEVTPRNKIITTNKFENEQCLLDISEAHHYLSKLERNRGLERKIPLQDILEERWNLEY